MSVSSLSTFMGVPAVRLWEFDCRNPLHHDASGGLPVHYYRAQSQAVVARVSPAAGGPAAVRCSVAGGASSPVLRWRLPSRESRAGRFLFMVGGDVLCMSPLYFFARLLSALARP